MKLSKKIALVGVALVMLLTSGCYFLPEEEEVLEAPVVKASEVSYTTTTATLKDIAKQVLTAGTIASGTEYKAKFSSIGGNIKAVYVNAGDIVNEGDLIAEYETFTLDEEIKIKELELQREELEYQIAIEKGESETVKAKELLDVQLMQNELDKLYAEKDATKLYAKVGGTVSYVATLSPGDWVNAGETIATIIDLSDLYVKINPNSETDQFMIGRNITIRYNGEYFDGTIVENKSGYMWDEETQSAQLDENGEKVIGTKSENVIVKFDELIPETSAVGNIADTLLILEKRENVIVISSNLIKSSGGIKYVYVFKDNQKIQANVTVGLESGSLCEITSGLEEGDEIIIR